MASTTYYWDDQSDNVVLEEDENGDPIVEYVQEPGRYGEFISQRRDGEVYYHHFDARGDTRAVSDENEEIVETATYSAFGEVVEKTTSITNPFGFIGALGYYTNSEANDVYVRARTYTPNDARWTSKDALSIFTSYIYVSNRPLQFVDPSGQVEQKCCDPCRSPRHPKVHVGWFPSYPRFVGECPSWDFNRFVLMPWLVELKQKCLLPLYWDPIEACKGRDCCNCPPFHICWASERENLSGSLILKDPPVVATVSCDFWWDHSPRPPFITRTPPGQGKKCSYQGKAVIKVNFQMVTGKCAPPVLVDPNVV